MRTPVIAAISSIILTSIALSGCGRSSKVDFLEQSEFSSMAACKEEAAKSRQARAADISKIEENERIGTAYIAILLTNDGKSLVQLCDQTAPDRVLYSLTRKK